jgi:DNA topoisomerase-1
LDAQFIKQDLSNKMTNLVIVESPAKCGKIQGFLGQGWKVIASVGHIRHLKEELESVGLDKDFEPTWEWMKEKSKAINALKDAAKGVDTIYLASDDDREGEMIAYSVCLLLRLNPATTPRAVFHEITSSAVKAAIESPRRLDMNKVNAAQARSVLDMLVGFTISPLLWKSVGPALSAGRCQTPALRLVVDRENDISQFKSQSSWKIHGTWSSGSSGQVWPAHLTDELEDRDSAEAYLELHHDKPNGTILKAETTDWQESPPLPLVTSTLQQQASSQLRCNPKETMKIAQRLYEAGHITYMRTDKATLSEEAIEAAKETVKQLYGEEYIQSSSKAKSSKTAKKSEKVEVKAQEAHEAIRPTHFELQALPEENGTWTQRDRKVYELIWARAVQSVMSACKGQQRTIVFVADGDDPEDFKWRGSWRKRTFDGWRRIGSIQSSGDSSEDENAQESLWSYGLTLKEGTNLTWKTLSGDPHETKAPQRYTEATLIRELEQKGIGRPSTFASLISTIMDKEYVVTKSFEGRTIPIEKLQLTNHCTWPPKILKESKKLGAEKDRLTPTPLGSSVLNFLLKHFDMLFNYGFTAEMESRLDKIAEGTEEWKQVLRDTWTTYKDKYTSLKSVKSEQVQQKENRKEFGNGLVATLTKKGPLLLRESPDGAKEKTVFYGWPEGIEFPGITKEIAEAFVESEKKTKEGAILGEYEGHKILQKSGKFGTYVEWNGKRTSCEESDTLESIKQKLSSLNETQVRRGAFEIRKGPYGYYMFKWESKGPSRKFVNVPDEIKFQTIPESELEKIYKLGCKAKADSARGGYGGRGRGGFRGRGRGQ